MKRFIVFFIVLFFVFEPCIIFCQETEGQTNQFESNIKEDFKRFGDNLKKEAVNTGEKIGEWFSKQSKQLEENIEANKTYQAEAGIPGSQKKIGVVLSVNTNNNTITVINTDGSNFIFGVSKDTVIRSQDAITGLQTPFTGGKEIKLSKINQGDWIHYSYNFGDYVKSVLPDSDATTVVARTIDVLR